MREELSPRDARDRMIVALDLKDVEGARRIVATLGGRASFYKIGMELVFAGGLMLIKELTHAGKRVFLDMKLLDIDATVAGGVRSISSLGATFTTIHAYPTAMRAAVAARPEGGPGLLAVTVLTSLDDVDLRRAGYAEGAEALVARRAADARAAGMDGIVCSPLEAESVRTIVGPDLVIVTPGVRASGSAAGDQKRTLSPGDAISAGADYLVVGRPITSAPDPAQAADAVVAEIERAL
jgi:orotidine-5'-phosphate decarboxylase